MMKIVQKIVLALFMLIGVNSLATGQNRMDSLRLMLDTKKVPDSTYLKTAAELCTILVNTESEFLLPEYAKKGLSISNRSKDIHSIAALHGFLGNHYWQDGKLSEAADQFNQMRIIGETHNNLNITSNSYIGLGTVYFIMKDLDQAISYYQKGLAIAGTDSLLRVRFYTNIANIFFSQNKMDSALTYYNRSVDYYRTHNNYRYLSIAYYNITLVYEKLHDGKQIRNYVTLALEAAKKSNDPYQIAAIYQIMGFLALEQHPDLAIRCYKIALDLAKGSQSFDQIKISLEQLANLSEESGNIKQSLIYLKEIRTLDDSLDLAQSKSRILQMESDHLVALRNAEQIKKDQLLEMKAIRDEGRQRILILVLSLGFLGLLVVLLSGLHAYRTKTKVNKTKERFFSMIAHDIRNPFSGILGLSEILNDEAENSEDIVHRKRVKSLHQSLNHVYSLLENLLQWSQSETGKIAFNPQLQLLSPFVYDVICLHTATGKQKEIRLENQIQSGLKARFDSNMLQTVIRNLLSNALKFSRENSSIFISAEIAGKEVLVKVKDQGVGMNAEQLNKLFKDGEGLSTPGTRNETGTGLGLILCKNFIAHHGGKIWAESKPGEGTTVFFTLPD